MLSKIKCGEPFAEKKHARVCGIRFAAGGGRAMQPGYTEG